MTKILKKQDLKKQDEYKQDEYKQDEDMDETEISYEAAYKLIDYLQNVSHFTDKQILDLIEYMRK